MPDANNALILHLQRLSTEDGPGIRTTVFFKGCPLHCTWCHNPESIPSYPQVQWLENRCIGCGTCIDTCPNHALSRLPDGAIVIDRSLCQGCGLCAEKCPANAMEHLGQTISLDDLTHELLKDRAYFNASNGGVTASGGEPTLQADFVAALFARLKSEGVHTALDTCGACSWTSLEKLLPYTDLVLYDLKLLNSERHYEGTGQHNHRILKNLVNLADLIRTGQIKSSLWIRTPLIPGATTSRDNLVAIGNFLDENFHGLVERWELCAFNNLCRDKYQRLNIAWEFEDTPLMTQQELDTCAAYAQSSAFDPSLILITGAVNTAVS